MAGETNPYAYIRAAAAGDLASQRALVREAERQAVEDDDIAAAIEGLVLARFAAVHGDLSDTIHLLGLLGIAAELCADDPQWSEWRDNLQGEAMAIVSQLADAGIESADQTLCTLVETSSERATVFAKEIRTLMAAM